MKSSGFASAGMANASRLGPDIRIRDDGRGRRNGSLKIGLGDLVGLLAEALQRDFHDEQSACRLDPALKLRPLLALRELEVVEEQVENEQVRRTPYGNPPLPRWPRLQHVEEPAKVEVPT